MWMRWRSHSLPLILDGGGRWETIKAKNERQFCFFVNMNNKKFLALILFYHALLEVFMKVRENVDYLHRFYYKTVADSVIP